MSSSKPRRKVQASDASQDSGKRLKFHPGETVSGKYVYSCNCDSCPRCSALKIQQQESGPEMIRIIRSVFIGINEKSEAYLALAKLWHSNKRNMCCMEPSSFMHEAFLSARMVISTRGMWESLKSFRDSYICPRSVTARRNDLIIQGMSRIQAEEFLRWICSKPASENFADVPVRIFGKQVNFTDVEYKELLLFVSTQNGLFRDEDSVDWYQPPNQKLERFHPEILRIAFRDKFYQDIIAWKHSDIHDFHNTNFYGLVDEEIINRQKEMYLRGNLIQCKMASIQFPLDCALSALRLQEFVNITDHIPWIRAACLVQWADRLITFRQIIDEFLQTTNPTNQADCLKFGCLQDDILYTYLIENPAMTQDLEAATNSILKEEPFLDKNISLPVVGSMNLRSICSKSLIQALDISEGINRKSLHASAVDAVVFQALKNYEKSLSGRRRLILYSEVHKRLLQKEPSGIDKLSEQDISTMLSDYEDENEENEEDEISENEMPRKDDFRSENLPSYSDMFCLRVLRKTEWQQIIKQACKFTNLNGLKDLDLWERIIKMSKVATTKPVKEIQAEFFRDVFPKLQTYTDENTRIALMSRIK